MKRSRQKHVRTKETWPWNWISLYRYNPDVDQKPYMKEYTLEVDEGSDMMPPDALILLKEQDPTIAFRRSCREGVCGSEVVWTWTVKTV